MFLLNPQTLLVQLNMLVFHNMLPTKERQCEENVHVSFSLAYKISPIILQREKCCVWNVNWRSKKVWLWFVIFGDLQIVCPKLPNNVFFAFAFVSNVNTVLLLGSSSVNHSCLRTFMNVLSSNQSQLEPSKYLSTYSKVRLSIILTIDVLFPGSWRKGLQWLSFSLCDYQCLQIQCKCLSFQKIQ